MSDIKSKAALELLNSRKENGSIQIENPQKLMDSLTERYGDAAPDLVFKAILEPENLMGEIGQEKASSSETLNYLAGDKISDNNIQTLRDVYGNPLPTQEQSQSYSASQAQEPMYDDYNNANQQQSADPWGDLFSSLLAMAMSAEIMRNMMYSPFPYHCHMFRDRIDHFNHCVDNRSKTGNVLDKVAGVAHGVAGVAHGVGHIIDAISDKRHR